MLDIALAHKHFKKVDPLVAGLLAVRQIDIPKAKPAAEFATSLYSSIVSQQLSTKAADTIWGRFVKLVGDPAKVDNILTQTVEDFRSIGLSRQKASYILNIAEHIKTGQLHINHLNDLSDDEVMAELIQIKGVGQWTAEMFLIFTLGRPDVFSAGDLGLYNAMRKLYAKPEMTREQALKLAAKWQPHRTVACLVLWHSLDNK